MLAARMVSLVSANVTKLVADGITVEGMRADW
jgi:hypothetical protein